MRAAEVAHIKKALSQCCYPDWSIQKAKSETETKTYKKKQKQRSVQDHKTTVNIPYVKDVSEAVTIVYKRYGVSTTMRPHTTIRNLLVHPKGKVNTEETAECVYRIPCKKFSIGLHWRNRGSHVRTSERSRSTGRVQIHQKHRDSLSQRRTNRLSLTMSTQKKITLSTGTRQQSSPVSLTVLHGGSGRLSRFRRRAKVS